MNILRLTLAAAILTLALFLPAPDALRQASADASGATFWAPPNYNFEAGPLEVGSGPTNYDFANGGSGWTKAGTGTASYSDGIATLSGSVMLTSSNYTLTDDVQSIKIRYKAGASANVSVLKGGSSAGTDDLSCVDCTAGEWAEKYIGVYTSAQGESVQIRFIQTSGTTEIDWVGTQWITFQTWSGPSAGTGIKSQAKQDESQGQFMEVRGTTRSGNFVLMENRLEFDYAFPLSTGNSLTLELRKASDDGLVASTSLTGDDPVDWTPITWSVSSEHVGEHVYLYLYSSESKPSWIDNFGINLAEAASREGLPTWKAGEPFDTSSGQFIHSHTDILVPGKGIPLEFTRYYHSMVPTNGDIGHNWRHTYSTSLRIYEDDSVTVYYASGGAAYFEEDNGSYTPPDGVHDTLVKNQDDTYTLTTVSLVEYDFSEDGKLTSIADRNGNTTTVSYDGNGFLSEVEDAGGRTLTFTTDANGRITEVEDPLERTVGFDYENGDLVGVTDVKDGTTTYTYSNHRMTSLTDSNGHLQNENIYDGANRVVEQEDAVGGVTCVYYGSGPTYTSANCSGVSPAPDAGETVVVDPRGNKTTYGFDTSFRTTDIEDDLGNAVHYAYDDDNNVTCVTDQRGNKTAYKDYDDQGNVTQIIDAENTDQETCDLVEDGTSSRFGYTDMNDLAWEVDAAGHKTDYIYNADGNLTRVVRRLGDASADTDLDKYADGNDGEGSIGTDPYDDCADTSTASDEDDDKWPPDFDDNQVINITDVGNVLPPYFGRSCANYPNWYVEGYPRRDLVPDCVINISDVGKVLPPTFGTNCANPTNVGALTCFERDGHGLVTAAVESTDLVLPADPEAACTGNKTVFDYDDYGNQTEVVDPRFSGQPTPPKTTLTYDDGGRMETVTNELNETTTYTYDDQNNVLTVEDNLGNTTTNTYDAKGNLESVTDANRQPAGTGPEDGVDECGDNGTGDGENDDWPDDEVADDGCYSAIYKYDDADRLESVIGAFVVTTGAPVTSYGYDANGNRTSVTNANRQPVGDPETGTDCGASGTGDGDDDDSDEAVDDGCPSTIYAYDELNRLESETDALGRVTSYGYDAAGNLDDRTDARLRFTDYVYDDLNRLEHIDYYEYQGSPLDYSVDYDYDEVGNRTQMVDPTGTTIYVYDDLDRPTSVSFPGPTSVAYQYDNVGNRTKITYPDSKYVNYTYDQAGNMKTVTDWLSMQTVYTYDDAGNLTDTDLPNDVDTDYTYDAAGRLESVANVGPGPTTISSFDYTLDAVGNRTEMEDLDGTHSYEYDALYRLTEVTYPDEETDAYTYDAVGNRLTKDTDDYTYDAADQLTDLEGTSFDYDDNGNQTDRGDDWFEYDHENRLTESVIDSVTSTSVYNGDGLRMSHTVSGIGTTSYTWDVAAGLPVVLQDGTNTYVYGLDLISATDGAGDQTYFSYDGLGSTSDLTDDEGDAVDGYTYDVFGALRSGSPGATDFLFTGEQRDADSDMYYLRARYYDPETGRFLSQDPVPSNNLYAYVRNNPTNLIDPYGLFGFGDVVGCVGDPIKCGEDIIEEGEDAVEEVTGVDDFLNETLPGAFHAVEEALGDLGYVDINGTVCIGPCLTGGLQMSFGEGFHPYVGTGYGFTIGGSVTVAPGQHIVTGWGCGLSASAAPPGSLVGGTAQVGYSGYDSKEGPNFFHEYGLAIGPAPFGFANTCYYVF